MIDEDYEGVVGEIGYCVEYVDVVVLGDVGVMDQVWYLECDGVYCQYYCEIDCYQQLYLWIVEDVGEGGDGFVLFFVGQFFVQQVFLFVVELCYLFEVFWQ